MTSRHYSALDQLLAKADNALRTLTPGVTTGDRPTPCPIGDIAHNAKRHTAGLMRINHTGEVCAQALYQGQAATAKLPNVRHAMEEAAREEEDHLAWCEERLRELDSAPSKLNPIFYALSFGIGATAGLIGDKWSLGIVAETEHQVVKHLENHLSQLPESDQRSRAILEQMREDELQHAVLAEQSGGAPLPLPIKLGMALMSKVMTFSTYRI